MAESILRHLAGDQFEALSAGSFPSGYIHPLAIDATNHLGMPIEGQRSKSWDELQDETIDAVITLCDHAAGESCPVWPGNPIRVHWPLSDPAAFLGTEDEQRAYAVLMAERLRAKIDALVRLDWSQERSELAKCLETLGES